MFHPIKIMKALSQAHIINIYCKVLGEHIKVLKIYISALYFQDTKDKHYRNVWTKGALDPKA